MSYLYILITKDELELPLAVADSPSELSKMIGVSSNTIKSSISKTKKKGKWSRYIKVEVEK